MPEVRRASFCARVPLRSAPIPVSRPPDVDGHSRASKPGKREVISESFEIDRGQRSGPHEQREFHPYADEIGWFRRPESGELKAFSRGSGLG